MKNFLNKNFIIFLCFIMILTLFSAVFAEGENAQNYEAGVITGFEPESYETTINTEYKYALIVLKEQFPERLTVHLGNEVTGQEESVTDYVTQSVEVTWKCRENYDDDLEVFHFVPDFGEYKLADGLELPEITVNVLGELSIPPLHPIPEDLFPSFSLSEVETITGKALPPSSYNGYTLGVLPDIRDQGNYGICWAFSSIACVEADLIHDNNAGTDIDLSELHLAYFSLHGFYDEKGLNIGDTVRVNGADYLDTAANAYFASFPLTNMLGPVNESVVPYRLAPSYSPNNRQGRIGDYQISGVYFYDILNDRESVKNAIMEHGGVSIVFNADKNNWSPTYNSYYYPTNTGTNHVVTLVGWDDQFPKSNFRTQPAGDGAWLVRNSWGVNGYNFNGYFWMSYYDKSIYSLAVAFDAETMRYDHVYAYDNCPEYNGIQTDSGVTVSQSFYVDAGETIEAVGFLFDVPDLSLIVTVSSGNSSSSESFNTSAPGYYLIPLQNPLSIQNRSKVTVSYSLSGSDYTFASYEEGPVTMIDSVKRTTVFTAGKGSDGLIINGINTGYDGKIKLFTNGGHHSPIQPVGPDLHRIDYPYPGDKCLPATGFTGSEKPMMPENFDYQHTGMRVEIPSISMSADIVKVPHDGSSYLTDWLGDSVGVLEGYALPGNGPSVIVGHNHLNLQETGPLVNLYDVDEGDKIFIQSESGDVKIYTVFTNEKISENDFTAMERIANMKENAIVFLTCEDERIEGGYANRRVIAAMP